MLTVFINISGNYLVKYTCAYLGGGYPELSTHLKLLATRALDRGEIALVDS